MSITQDDGPDTVDISGAIESGTEIVISNNTFSDGGNYEYTAHISLEDYEHAPIDITFDFDVIEIPDVAIEIEKEFNEDQDLMLNANIECSPSCPSSSLITYEWSCSKSNSVGGSFSTCSGTGTDIFGV